MPDTTYDVWAELGAQAKAENEPQGGILIAYPDGRSFYVTFDARDILRDDADQRVWKPARLALTLKIKESH